MPGHVEQSFRAERAARVAVRNKSIDDFMRKVPSRQLSPLVVVFDESRAADRFSVAIRRKDNPPGIVMTVDPRE